MKSICQRLIPLSVRCAINALYQVNSLITRSDATETELGGLIDGVNALIVQLHQTLSLHGAGTSADIDTDDTVSPGGGQDDSPSGGSGESSGGSSGGSSDSGTEMD